MCHFNCTMTTSSVNLNMFFLFLFKGTCPRIVNHNIRTEIYEVKGRVPMGKIYFRQILLEGTVKISNWPAHIATTRI